MIVYITMMQASDFNFLFENHERTGVAHVKYRAPCQNVSMSKKLERHPHTRIWCMPNFTGGAFLDLREIFM